MLKCVDEDANLFLVFRVCGNPVRCRFCQKMSPWGSPGLGYFYPDSNVHGANMGPIWGRQDPGGPHVGPMNFAVWVYIATLTVPPVIAKLSKWRFFFQSIHSTSANTVINWWFVPRSLCTRHLTSHQKPQCRLHVSLKPNNCHNTICAVTGSTGRGGNNEFSSIVPCD